MPQVQREAALRSFVEDDEITIFLVSLRSGGVGLNLANADRCYLLDIWWNPAGTQDDLMYFCSLCVCRS